MAPNLRYDEHPLDEPRATTEVTMHLSKKKATIGSAVLASALLAGGLTSGVANASHEDPTGLLATPTETRATLRPLNNSGVFGASTVSVDHRALDITVDARKLAKDLPHAQHIHFGARARNECPTVRDDDNGDFRLTTAEGLPAYGPVKVSLTTRGATGPGSVLAVDRYPTAPNRQIHYDRETTTTKGVARGIRNGRGVVVIHGVDYNANGKYDFRSAGKSELDPSLPAEATDPAACGVLHVVD
ncbi:MAG TPA: hypothetical protein VGD51_03130 [Nocardioidaceae bacterium]